MNGLESEFTLADDETPDKGDDIEDIIPKNDNNFEKIYKFFLTHKEVNSENIILNANKIRRENIEHNVKSHQSNNNEDLILSSGNYSFLEGYLKEKISSVILNGGRVLVLAPYWNLTYKNVDINLENPYFTELKAYFQKILNGNEKYSDHFDVQVYSSAFEEDLKKSIVITSAYDLLFDNRLIENHKNTWFSNLDLVIFENVLEQNTLNRISQSSISIILKSLNSNVKFWFLNSSNQSLEEGIRSLFLREGTITHDNFIERTENYSYHLGFGKEKKSLQRVLYNVGNTDYMGTSPIVINESLKNGIESYQWVSTANEPDEDYLEEYDQINIKRGGDIKINEQNLIQFISDEQKPFFSTGDYYKNLSHLIYRLRTTSNNKVFYAISSSPYLFRDYMTANIKYFSTHYLHPISPKIDLENLRNKLVILFESLKKHKFTRQNIEELFSLGRGELDLIGYLDKEFRKYFNFEDLRKYISIEYTTDFFEQWEPKKTYHIKFDSDIALNESFEYFDIKDGTSPKSNSFGKIQKDLALQFFLRKPQHIYHKKSFVVDSIDDENNLILLKHEQEQIAKKWLSSKNIIDIEINAFQGSLPPIEFQRIEKRKGYIDIDYTVKVKGRYDFEGHIDFDYTKARIINSESFSNLFQVTQNANKYLNRNYINDRAYYYSLNLNNNKYIKNEKHIAEVGNTLVFLIQEALVTFFPDSTDFIHVTCLNNEIDDQAYQIIPRTINEEKNLNEEGWLTLIIFEDANMDLGLIQAIKSRFETEILSYIDDFIVWHIFHYMTDENGEAQSNSHIPLSVEEGNIIEGIGDANPDFTNLTSSYLHCINGKYPNFFDLKATKKLLQLILGDNIKTSSRLKFCDNEDISEILDDTEKDNLDHYCDYCNSLIKGNDIHKIKEDGRELCPSCQESVINGEEEVNEKIRNEISEFFKYFNQTIPTRNLKVSYTNTKIIQEHFGKVFRPTRFYDPRTLGFASFRGDDYKIQIENMMPEQNFILTTIHEWVHIWQYQNLDYQKMVKEYDKYLVEGHTTWCEIFYANAIKHWDGDWENRLAPLSRKDEYGDGYRMMVKLLNENPNFKDDPFKFLLHKYPKN
jgi:hypothetical protein